MDRIKPKKTWTRARIALLSGGILLVALLLYSFLLADRRSRLNVDPEKISYGTVTRGNFLEFIPVTGTVQPIKTIFIDATQGGTVQRIYRESGAMVQRGDVLLQLSNASLELDFMTRETQTTEQLNNMRNTRLSLEQNSLNLANTLAEIDYRVAMLKPHYARMKTLFEQGAVSARDWEQVKEEYEYNLNRRRITYASFRRDSLLRVEQSRQLDRQAGSMVEQLQAIRDLRQNMLIRAPETGQYAAPELQVGQNITPGARLGQIDVLDAFKARVRIDELYLPRINPGQKGTFEFDGKTYTLVITKIFPTIAEGRFEVDMEFVGKFPDGIKRGQTLHIRLELGNPAQAVLLPMGGFYKDTGGNYVFVVDADGSRAVQRKITLGRKNPEYFEVLSGLEPGEKVIISSYENFGTNEVLVLK